MIALRATFRQAGLAMVLCIAASGFAMLATDAALADDRDSFTEATKGILKKNRLKRVAKEDPGEAIRTLDVLRPSEGSGVISAAIAEIALRAAGRETLHRAKVST